MGWKNPICQNSIIPGFHLLTHLSILPFPYSTLFLRHLAYAEWQHVVNAFLLEVNRGDNKKRGRDSLPPPVMQVLSLALDNPGQHHLMLWAD